MTALAMIGEGFSRWIDGVADTAVAWHGRLASPRVVRLVEDENGEFMLGSDRATDAQGEAVRITHGRITAPGSLALLAGSHVELMLRPERFLFQPLDLPDRAIEFLDGIVRAQIDRVTPWSAAEAAFGFSKPAAPVDGRITESVATAPRDVVTPYVEAIAGLGAQSIAVFTTLPDVEAEATPIKVLEHEVRGAIEVGRVRRVLAMTFMGAMIAAGLAVAAFGIIDAVVAARQNELAGQIGLARAAAVASRDAASGSLTAVRTTLAQRKQTGSSSVLVLDALSKVLPDDTYVSELRIEGDKLRLTGVTRDAPSLIGLIEQSGFTQASFFAPTTRSPSQPGERFHIEAIIRPRS